MKQKIRALIVDDEPPGVEGVRLLLADDPEVEVVGVCANGRDAIRAIDELVPDLVFLDVMMPQIDGFEVLEAVDMKKMPLVIFVTAHREFACQAFDVHAVDYLRKPYSASRFEKALGRAKHRLLTESRDVISERTNALLEERRVRYPDQLWVKNNESLLPVRTSDIHWIEVKNHTVRIHVDGGSSYERRQPLSDLQAQLDPKKFWRIERSYIVNRHQIKKINPLSENKWEVVMKCGETLSMSRDYHKRLKDLGWDL